MASTESGCGTCGHTRALHGRRGAGACRHGRLGAAMAALLDQPAVEECRCKRFRKTKALEQRSHLHPAAEMAAHEADDEG